MQDSASHRPVDFHPSLVVLVFLLVSIPFLSKAYHIDDPLFLWIAQHLRTDPANFYGFNVNWYGESTPMSSVTQNPPLASYYMAAASTITGWGETSMHILFLLPAIAALMGTFRLARKFCTRPAEAALSALATPVFLLSSTTVMCDMLMLCLWVWAVIFWIEGLSSESNWRLLLSAVTIAVCALTKYFGVSLIPLLFVYTVLRQPRTWRALLFLLIPLAAMAGYQWLTSILYGRGLLFNAVSYATSFGTLGSPALVPKIITGLIFTGGCLFTVAFYAGRLWNRRTVLVGISCVVPVLIALAMMNSLGGFSFHDTGGFRWWTLLQAGAMAAAGIGVVVLAIAGWREERSAESILLLLWICGTLLFAIVINWTVNGRSLLPMAPAFGILMMRRAERRMSPVPASAGRLHRTWPLAPALVLAFVVTFADFRLANTARDAASDIMDREKNAGGSVWFEGHWGFQYYMERLGGKPLDVNTTSLAAGDIVVIPFNNTSLYQLPDRSVPLSRTIEFSPFPFLTTMNYLAGAGFYADVWGPLPFVIGKAPPERYLIYTVRSPLQIR